MTVFLKIKKKAVQTELNSDLRHSFLYNKTIHIYIYEETKNKMENYSNPKFMINVYRPTELQIPLIWMSLGLNIL